MENELETWENIISKIMMKNDLEDIIFSLCLLV